MLTVQMMIGSAEVDRRNGSSQSRYHGYTTGAHRMEAAIGQANAYDGHASDRLLSQIAVRMPMRTASPGLAPVQWTVNCFRDRHCALSEGGTEIAPTLSIVDPEGTVRSLIARDRSYIRGER